MTTRDILVVIAGPTAIGKTELAVRLAEWLNGEVISADSRQLYRHLDIGTGKPTAEDRRRVTFHLLDVADPPETYSAARYAAAAHEVIGRVLERGSLPIVAGGTGLYIRALVGGLFPSPPADEALRERLLKEERERPGCLFARLEKLDPVAAAGIMPANLVRIIRTLEIIMLTGETASAQRQRHGFPDRRYEVLSFGLRMPRVALWTRIERRVDEMFERGLVAEVEGLLARGYDPAAPAMSSLGYREVAAMLRGECDLEEAKARMKTGTRRYAKRQMTWFRKEPRLTWIDLDEQGDLDAAMERIITMVRSRVQCQE
ncbi:tRNA (adenosine(37)-N6)-dimethylallyltransferase MiaA [bacterium]|nr:tRNA (adenosine(37)-N6)-dimethylallyltransferase MiaA [candidate division CSSED10-310 bacterium]